jgi:hypothetical protein
MNSQHALRITHYASRITFHVSRLTFPIIILCLFGSLNVAFAQVVNEDFRAAADVFLRRLTSAEHQGMGGSFAGSIAGANALNSNPAGLSVIDNNRFVAHFARFPRTVAVISKPNEAERYEDYGQYDLRASGLEFMNYSVPMGSAGVIGFDFAFEHDGRFSRVNNLGKATNNFPENNFVVGFGYGVNLFGGLAIGVDAKWMRSKVQDLQNKEHIGHGYAYNVGLIQQLGNHFRIGAVTRNLSNGLSFSDNAIPDRLQRDVLLGGAYQLHHKNVDIQIGLDVNPPFEDGIRTNIGGEIWYRRFVGGRIGYLRHTEKRYDSLFLLEREQVESEERLWKTEGLTLGLGLNLGSITLNAAYTPQMKPIANENEQVRIDQGETVYSFSIGQGF